MSSEKALILEFSQTEAMKSILPHPAILSSHEAKWEGIHVEYHNQPANECPEHYLQQHTIGIMLSSTIGGAIVIFICIQLVINLHVVKKKARGYRQ